MWAVRLAAVTAWCKYPRSHGSWSVAAVPALLSDPLPRPEAKWSTVPEGMPSDALGDPQLLGNRADVPAHRLLSPVRIFSAATRTGKHPMLRLLVGVLLAPALQGLDQVLVKWNGLLRGLGLAGADHLTYHRSRHSELSDFEINILPLQTEQFALSESGAYVQEHQDSFSRRSAANKCRTSSIVITLGALRRLALGAPIG